MAPRCPTPDRGRLTATAAGTGCSAGTGTCTSAKYAVSVDYTPDGDVGSANDSVNGNWTYTYDDFNRLARSLRQTGHLSYTYAYDRYGNMWHGDGSLSLGFSGGNNRIDGFSYDAAGNLLNDGVHSYTYDAENRLISVDGGATSYFYDAEGHRLEKRASGTPTFDYFYGRDGKLLILIQTNGAPLYQEIYAGGMHLATHTLNAAHNGTDTYFHHNDWLGTERARTDWAGNLCETVTSLPYGDDQNISTTCPEGDISPMHFTGKERDSESALDYFNARHYSSAMGRFMSPDPDNAGAINEDPQTWNAYSYVRNNPLKYVDPDGTDVRICIDGQDKCQVLGDQQYADLYKQQNGQQGINLPGGNFPTGDITCGGAKCGTATYFEPGLESDNFVNFAIGGLFKTAIEGGVGLLEGLFGSGARTAAGEAAAGAATNAGTGAAEQVVANGTKATVWELIEKSALSDAQKAAAKAALRAGAAGDKFTVEKLADGSLKVIREVAGRAGGKAVYEQEIDAAGKTVSVVKSSFNAGGDLMNVKQKFP